MSRRGSLLALAESVGADGASQRGAASDAFYKQARIVCKENVRVGTTLEKDDHETPNMTAPITAMSAKNCGFEYGRRWKSLVDTICLDPEGVIDNKFVKLNSRAIV